MMVSITVVPMLSCVVPFGCGDATPLVGKSPGAVVVCVVPLGAGEVTPLVGKSPARAEAERTHAKAVAAKNRFIFFSFNLRMQGFLHNGSIKQFSPLLARS